jgi:cyclin A
MADKENAAPVAASGPRLTRAAAKRAAAGSGGPSRGAKRKRVALAELPIAVSNAAAVPRSPSPHLPVKPAKPAPPSDGDEEEQHADRTRRASASPPASAEEASSGDSQLCGSYASDIYTYLRTMEVPLLPHPTPKHDPHFPQRGGQIHGRWAARDLMIT